jgi:hexosaminidase
MKTFKNLLRLLMVICALIVSPPVRAQQPTSPGVVPGRLNLMPIPGSVEMRTDRLPVTSSFNVVIKDYADDRLRAGIARTIRRLAGRTVLTLALDPAADESAATLVVQCERAGEAIPSVAENESGVS